MTQRKKIEDVCRLLEHAYNAINELRGEVDEELFQYLESLSDGAASNVYADMYGTIKAIHRWLHDRRREEIVMDEVDFAPR